MSLQRQTTPGMLATFAFCGEVVAAGAGAYLMMWRYERDESYLSIGIVLAASAALWLIGVWRWSRRAQAQSAALASEDLLGRRVHEWARRGPDRRQSRVDLPVEREPI